MAKYRVTRGATSREIDVAEILTEAGALAFMDKAGDPLLILAPGQWERVERLPDGPVIG